MNSDAKALRLFEGHLEFFASCLRQYFHGRVAEREMVENAALVGLWMAALTYNRRKNHTGNFKGYAYICMRNEIRMETRRWRFVSPQQRQICYLTPSDFNRETTDCGLMRMEYEELVQAVRSRLSSKQLRVFEAYFKHELALEDISCQEKVTRERVRQIVDDIIEKAKLILEAKGYEEHVCQTYTRRKGHWRLDRSLMKRHPKWLKRSYGQ